MNTKTHACMPTHNYILQYINLAIIFNTPDVLYLSVQTIQKRGAAIIKARKLSSAMSAAKAICDHMRNWWFGTPPVRKPQFEIQSNGVNALFTFLTG